MNRLYHFLSLALLALLSLPTWAQTVKPYAENPTSPGRLTGNLVGQINKFENYLNPPEATWFPERIFKITTTRPTHLRMKRLVNSGHYLAVIDTTGIPQHVIGKMANDPWYGQYYDPYNRADTLLTANLTAGTSYAIVEQSSSSADDMFDFSFYLECLPQVNIGSIFTKAFWLNAFSDTKVDNGGYTDLAEVTLPSTLYIGQRNYLHTVRNTSGALYDKLYVDFNGDGDFDDNSERIYASGSATGDSVQVFNLSTSNTIYAGANGKRLNARLISSGSASLSSACGNVGDGSVIDFYVTVQVPPAYSPGGDYVWARLTQGPQNEYYGRVRTAPDGSIYVSGSYDAAPVSPIYYPLNAASLVTFNGLPGKRNQVQKQEQYGWAYKQLLRNGMVAKYGKDGTLIWNAYVRSPGTGSNITTGNYGIGYAEITAMATDKYGYCYVSGVVSGATANLHTSVGSTVEVGANNAFLAKIHPNGTIVYAFPIGNEFTNIKGLDVAPDLRLYVAGDFRSPITVKGQTGTAVNLTSRGNYDAFLAKFSDIGTLYWVIQAGGTGNDFANGAAADISGGGYLMGSYEGTATFNSTLGGASIAKTSVGGSDGFVLGVSQTGNLNWVASMGGPLNENVKDVAPDPRGTGIVAVGGFSGTASFGSTSLSSGGFYDAFATRISNTGTFQWATKAGGFGQEQAWSVRMDKQGNPWVGLAYSANIPSAFGGRAIAAKSDQNGAFVKLNAATGVLDAANPIGLVPRLQQGAQTRPIAVDTVDNGGAVVAGSFGTARTWKPVGGGYVYVAVTDTTRFGRLGRFQGDIGYNGFLARFSNPVASLLRQGADENFAHAASPLHVFPNPSAEAPTLLLEHASDATVTVFNASGQYVFQAQVAGEALAQGYRLPADLKPGVYMVRAGQHAARFVTQ